MIEIEISNNKIIAVFRVNYLGKRKLLKQYIDYKTVDYEKKVEDRKYKVNYLDQTYYI